MIQKPILSLVLALGLLLGIARPQQAHAIADDHQIFVGSCSGTKTNFDLRLDKACEKYPGKVLVRCKHECTERKFLKCTKHKWIQTEILADGSVCQSDGDRNKTRDCNPTELTALQAAYKSAKKQTPELLTQVSAVAAAMKKSKDSSASKWEKAESCLRKIVSSMEDQYTYACPDDGKGINGNFCKNKKQALAFDRSGGVRKIFFCEWYFGFNAQTQASTITHEMSHEVCNTNDSGPNGGYYKDSSDIRSDEPWDTTASTYDNWLDYGFCIPGKSSCQTYTAWKAAQK